MKIEKFEDIIAWQKAEKLAGNIYSQFSKCKDFSFRDQIQRAAVSIMNNIAEGYERGSNKEFRNFLYIAKSSCAEVRSMLYLGVKLGYLTEIDFKDNYVLSVETSKILSGLIKTL